MDVGSGEDLAGSVECCMCGDLGVIKELFRCRSCHSRYQHKYCSNLYPKVESYRSCNWCLTDEDAKKTKKIAAISSSGATTSDGNCLKRGSLSLWEWEKPVKKDDTKKKKKKKKLYRSVSDVSTAVGRGLKGKNRRYKLLEDVSA
ncbi:hypothetical protein ZOSMA_17G00290 [Zostera marina]|uniref:PHD-type zinc finger plants domain-containing protein n=1 Tax=Zostera marina TaxID=29655 RepID=A0A0K9PR83_ZOSMR|nr:hypothetical protein ZOSMA_17G00290 [Zostera marina]